MGGWGGRFELLPSSVVAGNSAFMDPSDARSVYDQTHQLNPHFRVEFNGRDAANPQYGHNDRAIQIDDLALCETRYSTGHE